MSRQGFFGAVDLGADQFVVLAAAKLGSDYELAGVGIVEAMGVEAGRITDLTKAGKALGAAVHQAEVMAGGKISQGVVAGIAGTHLAGEEKHAHVKIQGGSVRESDVELALDTLQAFPVASDQEILHVLEQEYSIDGNGGIRSPLGMTGALLEAYAYIVTVQTSAVANLRSCISDAGLSLQRLMSSSLAAGTAVTTADDRQLGVMSIDWGGSSCDVSVFRNEVPRLLRTIELGGVQIDRDVAKMFHVSLQEAKRVKEAIGSAVQVQVDEAASLTAKGTGGEVAKIEPHVLSMVIEARFEEMLNSLKHELGDLLVKDSLPAGVVVGGGLAKMPGFRELGHDVLGLPVRIGSPSYSGAHAEDVAGPQFATALGLLELWKYQGFVGHLADESGGLKNFFARLLKGNKQSSLATK